MRITSKQEFLDLHLAGRLGNIVPSWDTEQQARADGYDGPVMIRFKTPSSPFTTPNVPMDDVTRTLCELEAKGAPIYLAYLTHMTPGVRRRLNAQAWRGPSGLYLNYSRVQATMADTSGPGWRHAECSAALAILRWACDPSSYDDLMYLLDRYPDAVIELTAYEHPIGVLADSGRNTIFWEVRNY